MSQLSLHTKPKAINLDIELPASKSISNRALILNALAYSPFDVQNLSDCDDTRVMIQALNSNNTTFDIGAAGTTMRFLTAFLSKTVGEWVITGSERMKQRPIRILVDALNILGARIEYTEKKGYPPLKILGSALTGGEIHLNGGVSSQYISALMMIAPYMQNGLKIILEGKVISAPYIYMTKSMMKDFGVEVKFLNNIIEIHPQTYTPVKYKVESDWSAASYWYEVLALVGKGEILLKGLRKNSNQGDSKVAALFLQLGVSTDYHTESVTIKANQQYVTNFEFDFSDQPDLAQTIAVTCCMKQIPFLFKGVQSLKIKETDRVAALINELRKVGYILTEPSEGELEWTGQKDPNFVAGNIPTINTYEDHRMAMAFAPVSVFTPLTIENPEVVTKSYPQFWDEFSKIN